MAARKMWLDEQWEAGNRTCGICDLPIATRNEATVDHVVPGSGKIDNPSNWQVAHGGCNMEKGSRRDFKIDRDPRIWFWGYNQT